VDAARQPLWQTKRTLDVDTVCAGWGFLPSTSPSRHLGCSHFYDPLLDTHFPRHDAMMETDTPGVFVAGDIAGVGGKDLAILQGQVAALAILGKLGHFAPEAVAARVRRLGARLAREKRLADMLRERFRMRPGLLDLISDDTIVCRCEGVTAAEIRQAVASGARDVRGVKLRTRTGMGPCQGRYCGPTVGDIVARETGRSPADVGFMTVRPPLIPVPAADLLV